MFPEDLKYTKEHEWVRIDGDQVTVGITDHAQSQLGDITFVELPEKEKEVNQSDSIATVESVKAASDIYSPLSGKVTEVNSALEEAPETINRSCYEEGWICRISVRTPGELEGLLNASAYEAYLEELKK